MNFMVIAILIANKIYFIQLIDQLFLIQLTNDIFY